MELEQRGPLGAPVGPGAAALAGAQVGCIPGPGAGSPAGPSPTPTGDSLAQMPFYSSELPQDFLQSPPASRPQLQSQAGAPFPQQGFPGGPLHPGAASGGASGERALPEHRPPMEARTRLPGPTGPSAQAQVHSPGIGGAGMTPLLPSVPCSSSGGPASLIHLYSDIIPDDKPKKKRSRKRDGDDSGNGARTPLSSHSDDITAPLTPAVSDTSCSTPTPGIVDLSDFSFPQGSSFPGLAPSSELERQLSVSSAAQERASTLGLEAQRGPLCGARLEVKVR